MTALDLWVTWEHYFPVFNYTIIDALNPCFWRRKYLGHCMHAFLQMLMNSTSHTSV
jgi:hypothetical protein